MAIQMKLDKTVPLVEMKKLRYLVSQESVSVGGIVRSIKDLIPALQTNFKEFIGNFTKTDSPITLKADEQAFTTLVMKRPYLTLEGYGAHVPEGMRSTYLEYAMALQTAAQHCHNIAQKSLNDYSMMLAQVITNRQLKLSMPSHVVSYAKMEEERNKLTAVMGACFDLGSTKATATYGDVVGSNSEWQAVFRTMHITMDFLNRMQRDMLHKKAEECSENLALIIKQIKSGEFDGAGPEVIQNLSDGAYQVGCELELFSVVYFKATVLASAITDTMKNLTKTITEHPLT